MVDKQKTKQIWLKIVRICIWLLPFAAVGVMLLIKQFSGDYETVRNVFSVGGLVAMVVGLIIRLFADDVLTPNLNFIGRSLVYGGGVVLFGASVFLGQAQTTEPVQTETLSESIRSVILSFATVEQVHRFGIAVAVFNCGLLLYCIVRLILSIKWEVAEEIGKYAFNSIAFGGTLAMFIYVLTLFPV